MGQSKQGTSIAGDVEKGVFLAKIACRFEAFLKVAADIPWATENWKDVQEWSRHTQEAVANTFCEWYDIEVAGKRIPEGIQVPRPRRDRVYRKLGREFVDQVCAVCGDQRVLNIAHIVPRSDGGVDEPWNLMRMCANHHYLFDNHRLSEEEWSAIGWDKIDKRAHDYVRQHQEKMQRQFWASKDGGEHAK